MLAELVLTARRIAALAGCVAAVASCGDGFDTSGATSAASAGPGAGGGSVNASAASAASAGGAGAEGSCAREGCPEAMYCDDESDACVACSDLSDFELGNPEKLDALDQGVARRYPRGTSEPTELLFGVVDPANDVALWVTPDMLASPGQPIAGTVGGGRLHAPLEASVPVFGNANFFYDSGTEIYGATRNGASLSNVDMLPPAINTPGFANRSIAIASRAERAWWMRYPLSGDVAVEIFTASLASGDVPKPVEIVLEDSGCHRRGPDSTPWAHPDGTLLFFHENEYTAECMAPMAEIHDLYVVELDGAGQATKSAVKLGPSVSGEDERHPSMSSDMCWLYFTKGNGASSDLYRSPRK